MSSMRLYRRLAGFALLPLLSALAPLLLLPAIARTASLEQWVAIAVGQSVGAFGSIAVALGWPMNGPVQVAGGDVDARARLYLESLWSRGAMLAVAAPLIYFVAISVAPKGVGVLAATTAVAVSLGGLTPSWFAVGVGRPIDVALFDTLPRLLATATATLAIHNYGSLYAYPALILLGSGGGITAYSIRALRRDGIVSVRPLRVVLQAQAASAGSTITAAIYSTGSIALVTAATAPHEAALYASGARVYQFMLLGVTATSQAFIADAQEGFLSRAHLRRAGLMHAAVGIVGMTLLSCGGPTATRTLFTQSLAVSVPLASWLSLSYLILAMSTYITQQVLVPMGRHGSVLASAVIGCLVGIPATFLLSASAGATGGGAALALTNVAVLISLVYATFRRAGEHTAALRLPDW